MLFRPMCGSGAAPCVEVTLDRDENAAKNILAVGLAEKPNARGEGTRPKTAKRSQGRPPEKQEPFRALCLALA
jgi:transposase